MCPFLRQFKERFLFYFKFFCFVLRCMKLIIYIYMLEKYLYVIFFSMKKRTTIGYGFG